MENFFKGEVSIKRLNIEGERCNCLYNQNQES